MCAVFDKSKSYQLIFILVNAIAKLLMFVLCDQGNLYQLMFVMVKTIAISRCLLWSRQKPSIDVCCGQCNSYLLMFVVCAS